jgi:hypothetical protein
MICSRRIFIFDVDSDQNSWKQLLDVIYPVNLAIIEVFICSEFFPELDKITVCP